MIPEKVKVVGIDYKVEYKPVVKIYGSKDYTGSCNFDESIIQILDELSDDKKEQTFIHELVHAIFKEAGYDEQDEDMVNRLGIVLYQVLKDNDLRFGN